ncbi:class I SAM-dependent RNA methyltransferase [Rhodospirillaceae bacterium KN72]|uniref:Class I SAM-dependent RNA methyltransferase n=1 Tax=Pacificispira spongiicola TaxID=2729598 RepID=A0A7Y0HER7_9PROT|nr:class I SAM-dependent RNA methyltransferase [Pacificispira spongiicola]NMM45156.1 class I SAM-dependent RNA methyltransferase [Pacificispira spongiicola]
MSRRPRLTQPRHTHHRRQQSGRAEPIEALVSEIGARGDGIAQSDQGLLFVPGTAPGDRVLVRPGPRRGEGRAAELLEVLEPGPDRVDPPCPHAKSCGGCSLQHIHPDTIAGTKRSILADALAHRGFDADIVTETRSVGPGTRRRLRVAVRRLGGRTVLGFNERASGNLVDISVCPIARPELVSLFPALRKLAASLNSLGKGGDFQLTLTETGVDLLIVPMRDVDPDLGERRRMVDFAEDHDLARIAWEIDAIPEPIVARRDAVMRFGGVPVALPMGAFLQPSAEGEAILVELVRAAIPGGADAVADLYSGCGSLSLPLVADGRNVLAVEGESAPVGALRAATGGMRVQTECRDLARAPLTVRELDRFDAVVFDPPRAGAAAQAEELAHSKVPRVIAVSCNPSTLARDLRLLVDGGYVLDRVVPVDQFTWSAHVEAVAVLSRPTE